MTDSIEAAEVRACTCWRSAPEQIEVIPFGADLHLRALKKRGKPYWWIRAAICDHCGQYWLIAQEERLCDVYILRKLDGDETAALCDEAMWPTSFDRYGTLLTLCEAAGHSWRDWDGSSTSLLATAHVLKQECPDITIDEIAAVLRVGPADVRQIEASFEAVDPRSW